MPEQVVLEETVEQEIAISQPAALARMDPLLQLAAQGVPIETIKELVALYREERAYQAKREFAAAFAEFKAECPVITKDQKADFATKIGTRVKYTYAGLGHIAETLREHLHKYGFAFSWTRAHEGPLMTVTCRLLHRAGHSETSEFSVPIEGTSMMSEPQKYKAALSFAERVSLVMVLGLTDTDEDTDAQDEENMAVISQEHVDRLEGLIREVNVNRTKFLQYLGVASLAELPMSKLGIAMQAIERKRTAGKSEQRGLGV